MENQKKNKYSTQISVITIVIALFLSNGCWNGEDNPVSPGGYDVHPANPNSPYRNVLSYCIAQKYPSISRQLKMLPFIGQETDNPYVEDVMNRVLVSHDWMGNNFRALLSIMPADILELFKATTGVVISSDIRPAYYNPQTGAIYVDPVYLWLTNEEKLTINRQKDSRSAYGTTLQFSAIWRYLKDKRYAYSGTDWDKTYNRTIDEIKYGFAHLLYHELAHANDYFPPLKIREINKEQTVESAAYNLENERANVKISGNSAFRLNSGMLSRLANILYGGSQPTSIENDYKSDSVASEFRKDMANDMYNFYGIEDIAMIFEEIMLNYHFGMDRNVAITNKPSVQNPTAKDYTIEWGQKNRFMDDKIRQKCLQVTKLLLPRYDLTGFVASLGKPQDMIKNTSWADTMYVYKTVMVIPDMRFSGDDLLLNCVTLSNTGVK